MAMWETENLDSEAEIQTYWDEGSHILAHSELRHESVSAKCLRSGILEDTQDEIIVIEKASD